MVTIPGIPVSQQRVEVQPAGAAPSVSEAGLPGRTLTAIGETFGRIRQNTLKKEKQLLEEQQKRDAAAFRIKSVSEFTINQSQQLEQLKTSTEDIDTLSDSFLKGFDDDAQALLEEAPNELARVATAEKIAGVKERLAFKAFDFQASEKAAIQKNDINQSIDGLINNVLIDPDSYNETFDDITESIDLARNNLTPLEADILEDASLGTLNQMKITAEINRGNLQLATELLKDENFNAALEPEEVLSLNEQIKNEEERITKEITKLKEKATRMFVEDPAQFAIEQGAVTPNSIVAIQQAAGVQPDNIQVIPKENASLIVNQLNGINNADLMIKELDKLQQTYGDNYNIAMKDLKRGGLSANTVLISMMDPDQDKQIIDASFALGKIEKDVKELARARIGNDVNDIPDKVTGQLEQILDALTLENLNGGLNEVNNLHQRSINLANYFASIGKSANESVRLATGWLKSKGTFGDINGNTFRVPQPDVFDPDKVENGLEFVLDNLTKADVTIDVETEFVISDLKRNGKFVLNSAEDGYILLNEINQPVRDAGGVDVFTVSINDLVQEVTERTEEKEQERKSRIFKENLEKLFSEVGG